MSGDIEMSLTAAIVLALSTGASSQIIINQDVNPIKQVITSKSEKKPKLKTVIQNRPYFLLPITKQSFKQNRRKELKASARKKAK